MPGYTATCVKCGGAVKAGLLPSLTVAALIGLAAGTCGALAMALAHPSPLAGLAAFVGAVTGSAPFWWLYYYSVPLVTRGALLITQADVASRRGLTQASGPTEEMLACQ